MTVTHVKAMILKSLTAGLVAAAFFIATPGKASAQVAFGIHVGGPVPVYGHVHPVYGGYSHPGFYGSGYGYDRHLAFERHEAWERDHFYHDRRFYGR